MKSIQTLLSLTGCLFIAACQIGQGPGVQSSLAPPSASPLPSSLPPNSVQSPSLSLPFEILPSRTGFFGRVFDDKGLPLADVELIAKNAILSYNYQAKSDQDGYYEFKIAPRGAELIVTAQKKGYLSSEQKVTFSDENFLNNRLDFGADKTSDLNYLTALKADSL